MSLSKKTKSTEFSDIPSIHEQIQDIMNNFDFKHVHMMMEWDKSRVIYDDCGNHIGYHKWKTFHKPLYSDVSIDEMFNPANLKIPTIEELKQDAKRLLHEVVILAEKNKRVNFHMIGTGPFKATYRWGIIELECIFESWSCD